MTPGLMTNEDGYALVVDYFKIMTSKYSYRLERWSNFCGDAMAMVFFTKRCDDDGF